MDDVSSDGRRGRAPVTTGPNVSGLDPFFSESIVPSLLIDVGRREIIRVNAAALALLGLPEEQVIGRPGRDFLTEPSDDQVLRSRALRGDRTVVVREIATVTGPHIVEINMVPTGQDDVVFVQAVDMTDLLASTSHAKAQVDKLQRKTDALESLAARLAHDLRAPLTAIEGFSSVVREDRAAMSDDQIDGMLARVSANAHSLGSLIDSILEDAQIEVAGTSLATFDSQVLLDVVRDATAVQLAGAAGELVTTNDVDVLPVRASGLFQPLVNLVSNAIKYRSDDRRLRIAVSIVRVDDGVELTVADNGPGLGPDPEPLFGAGTRGESAGDTVGSGFGLSYARAAVETLGGTLEATSNGPDAPGAVFTIRVPDDADRAGPRATDTPGGLGDDLSGRVDGVVDVMPIPTVIIDLERRRIVRANDAMVRLVGVARSELVGRAGRTVLADPKVADMLRDAVLAAPGSFTSAASHVRSGDTTVPARIWVASIPGTVTAVAHIVPIGDEGDTPLRGDGDIARAIASIAHFSQRRARDLGVGGLADVLGRIERLASTEIATPAEPPSD